MRPCVPEPATEIPDLAVVRRERGRPDPEGEVPDDRDHAQLAATVALLGIRNVLH